LQDVIYDPNETFEVTLTNPSGGGATILDGLGVGTIIDDDEPSLLHVLLINEIGLNNGYSPESEESGLNFVEIRNAFQPQIGFNQDLNQISLEVVNPNDDKFTINIGTDNFQNNGPGLSDPKIVGNGFMVIFEDGTWATYSNDGNLQQYGTYSTSTTSWGLGATTAEPMAANLIQEPSPGVYGSIDLFVANDVDTSLLTAFSISTDGSEAAWKGDVTNSVAHAIFGDLVNVTQFNGQFSVGASDDGVNEPDIFARVYDDTSSGSDHYVADTNTADDWTITSETTVGDINNLASPNPEDPNNDDFNPLQDTGQVDDGIGGQTVIDASQDGSGDSDDDTLIGGRGPDLLIGDDDDNTISGDDHNDFLFGAGGDDEIHGGSGSDVIDGGPGEDTIYGDTGEDTIIDTMQESSTHMIDGGAGVDTVKFVRGSGDTITLDLTSGDIDLSNVEYLDMIDGDNSTDILRVDKTSVVALGDTNEADTIPIATGGDLGGHAGNVDIYVKGDTDDAVQLEYQTSTGEWSDTGDTITTQAGDTYNVWTNSVGGGDDAVIAIHEDIGTVTEEATS
jgi:hypothetical protein